MQPKILFNIFFILPRQISAQFIGHLVRLILSWFTLKALEFQSRLVFYGWDSTRPLLYPIMNFCHYAMPWSWQWQWQLLLPSVGTTLKPDQTKANHPITISNPQSHSQASFLPLRRQKTNAKISL